MTDTGNTALVRVGPGSIEHTEHQDLWKADRPHLAAVSRDHPKENR